MGEDFREKLYCKSKFLVAFFCFDPFALKQSYDLVETVTNGCLRQNIFLIFVLSSTWDKSCCL